jgi:hypothetical protein
MISRSSRDNGSPERWQHDRPVVRSMKMGSGKATEDVIAVEHPTDLDRLHNTGQLHIDVQASQRLLDAGLWLARCRGAAGLNARVCASYEVLGGIEDMSDDQAWNRRAYNDAMKAMGVAARAVEATVEGKYVPALKYTLIEGLELLAKHRGI